MDLTGPSWAIKNCTGSNAYFRCDGFYQQRPYFARHNDQAVAESEAALQEDPDFMAAQAVLGLATEAQGNYSKAILKFRKVLQLSDGRSTEYLDYLGHAYAISGDRREAATILAELDEKIKNGGTPDYRVATLVAIGEKEQVLKDLEKGFENGPYGFM